MLCEERQDSCDVANDGACVCVFKGVREGLQLVCSFC